MADPRAPAPPLRANRQLVLLLFSQAVGMVARGVYFVGLPLLVLERTGSAFSTSISLFLGFAPFTVAGPFAGYVVDRFSRRDLLVAANLLYGAVLLALPFAHAAWLIYVVAFTASLVGVVLANSIVALIPELALPGQLAKAASVYTFLRSATYLLSTASTFLFIRAMGRTNIFFLCSALLAACAPAGLAIGRDRPPGRAEGGGRRGESPAAGGFREVLRIMRRDADIRGLTLMHLMFMPIFGAFEVFLVLFCARRLGQADYYTLVSASVGAGLALGSLFTYRILARARPLYLVFASFLGYAAGVLLLTGSAALAPAMTVCFLVGIVGAFGFTTYEYLRQRVVPSAYRGRVFAVMDAVVLLPLPLGYLAVGYAAERAGIVSIGLVLSAVGLCLALLSYPLARGPRLSAPPRNMGSGLES